MEKISEIFDINEMLKGFDIQKHSVCTSQGCENDVYGKVMRENDKLYTRAFTSPENGDPIYDCNDCRDREIYTPRIEREIRKSEKDSLLAKKKRVDSEEKETEKKKYKNYKGSGRFQ